jgi:hypothetical protein
MTIIHTTKLDTTPHSDGVVVLEHAALRTEHGWIPVTRQCCDIHKPWTRETARLHEKDTALALAKHYATEHAAHYCGDWTIIIRDHGEV